MKLQEIRDEKTGSLPAYAWPGGYPIYYVTGDGAALCPACVNDPSNPIHEDGGNDGWKVEGYDVNYEDPQLYCDHCNQRIASAYAEDEAGAL
jgi:hypothetical protein